MANRFINPIPQWVDDRGDPLTGGSIEFFLTGTTTHADTYSDSTETTPNPNPVLLNAAGRTSSDGINELDVFLNSNYVYRVVLRNVDGIVVRTIDGITDSVFNAPNLTPGGRLTLTTGVPVLTANGTTSTTVFYTPYLNNYVRLFDGSKWYSKPFTELSQQTSDALKSPASAVGFAAVYDMFVWDDAGTLRCTRGPAWSSLTSRGAAAELVRINGILVNSTSVTNGPAAQRGLYVGTIYVNSAGEVKMDMQLPAATGGSSSVLGVWNYYNRVKMYTESRNSSNATGFTSATWNGISLCGASAMVRGINEDVVTATAMLFVTNGASVLGVSFSVSMDGTTTPSGEIDSVVLPASSGVYVAMTAKQTIPQSTIGYHTFGAIQRHDASSGQIRSDYTAVGLPLGTAFVAVEMMA